MDKNTLINLINKNLTTAQLGVALNMSSSGARYWMRKYGLRVTGKNGGRRPTKQANIPLGNKCCPKCKKIKPFAEFYSKVKGKPTPSGYCRDCHGKWTKNRFRRFKQECLDYKETNSCVSCGYSKCIGALEFHHNDPAGKDFVMSQTKRVTLTDEIKQELDKCEVLCACCHREVHYGILFKEGDNWISRPETDT